MAEKTEITFYVVLNENGEITFDTDEATASTGMDEHYGGSCKRTIKFTLIATLPSVTELPAVDVPDEDTSGSVTLG